MGLAYLDLACVAGSNAGGGSASVPESPEVLSNNVNVVETPNDLHITQNRLHSFQHSLLS